MTPDDFELMAYVDGELDPQTSKRIAEAVDADPALQAKVEALIASREIARAAYEPAHDQPLSPALEQMMAELDHELKEDAETSSAPSQASGMTGSTAVLAWAQGRLAAMTAAGFAAGMMAAWAFVQQIQPEPFLTIADGSGTELSEAAQHVLNRASTGIELDGVTIEASFISDQGEACRQFELVDQRGVACLAQDAWRLIALVHKPAEQNFQAAGTTDPLAVAVAGLGVKHILSGQEEAARIENRWRPLEDDED